MILFLRLNGYVFRNDVVDDDSIVKIALDLAKDKMDLSELAKFLKINTVKIK